MCLYTGIWCEQILIQFKLTTPVLLSLKGALTMEPVWSQCTEHRRVIPKQSGWIKGWWVGVEVIVAGMKRYTYSQLLLSGVYDCTVDSLKPNLLVHLSAV